MKLNNKIKFMSCALVLISNFAWSQEITKKNTNCYVIAKDIVGTGGAPNSIIIGTGGTPNEIIGTGGSPSEIIGVGGSPNEVIGSGGIASYCTNEIIGTGGAS